MNYYRAAQRHSDKRWDFVKSRDKDTWPVGYCRAKPDTSKPVGGEPWPESEVASIEKNAAKYHTDGHATQEEAEACYTEYLIDGMRISRDDPRPCKGCGSLEGATLTIYSGPITVIRPVCAKCANHRPTLRKLLSVKSFASSC